ncbi:unnamed protein product, partial [Ectocarpus sp. 12 AP-2014]
GGNLGCCLLDKLIMGTESSWCWVCYVLGIFEFSVLGTQHGRCLNLNWPCMRLCCLQRGAAVPPPRAARARTGDNVQVDVLGWEKCRPDVYGFCFFSVIFFCAMSMFVMHTKD